MKKTYDKKEINLVTINKQKKTKINLAEKFKNYRGDTLTKCFDWDNPKGKEIW